MNHRWKTVAVCCLMALALVATLSVSCGEKGAQEQTIIIGDLTDMTGVAASALVPIELSMESLVKNINEEDPIPGVKLKIVRFDTGYDPSRTVPGYEWLRDQGAKVIYTALPEMAEVLVPFAKRDKVPVFCAVATKPMYDPPGWVFSLNQDATHMTFTVMKWIGDNWDYQAKGRKPKVGTAGWSSPYGNAVRDGAEYCLDHPDKFEYAGSYMAPVATVTWSGEVQALKDCDYVVLTTPGSLQPATFAKEFRAKGYTAKFVGLDSLTAYWDYMLQTIGSQGLDGALIGQTWPLWVHPAPLVDYMKDLANKYFSADKAHSLVYGNCGWISGGGQTVLYMEYIRKTIEAVGAENFSSQAVYDTAISFSPQLEGFKEIGWSPTERRIYKYIGMYEYRHSVGDFVVLKDWEKVIEQ